MILEFSITNFLSFKNKVTFTMIANNSNELKENYITLSDKNILKTCAIYGANASGKSNLIKAFTVFILMLRDSNNTNINATLPITPFTLDKKSALKPSSFEIKFIVDKTRYVYGFTADKNMIYEEYLYYYPNGRETKIFDRVKTSEYSFPQGEKKLLKDIANKTAPNKFFLATATNWNYEKTRLPYSFLSLSINTFNNISELKNNAIKKYIDNENNLKEFALDFLKKADFNIVDYEVYESEFPDEMFTGLPDYVVKEFKEKHKISNVLFKHKGNETTLKLEEESLGTQIIFAFIPYIMSAINNREIIIVDELDKSLHPFLDELIIQMFNDPEINKKGAQLIFNTHDTNLLNLNIFRRDQIWFTEKDGTTGISDLYPLSDFSPRKGENFEKGYLLGRYGAIPFIRNDFNLWIE